MSEKTEVNLSGVKQSQGVWLVKVPKYLSQQWDKATEKGDVGKISIGKKQGKTEVRFSLNEELTVLGAVGEKDESLQVPKDHPFTMHTVGGQTMAVFSQSDTAPSGGIFRPDGLYNPSCKFLVFPELCPARWMCPENLQRELSRRHPDTEQMPESPQLAPFEALLRAPSKMSQISSPSDPMEETHFGRL